MMRHIVWLDDDYDTLGSLVRLLQRDGHRVLRLRTVGEALDHVTDILSCDLLILDVLLPPGKAVMENDDHYRGRTLLRTFREEWGFNRPVIVCSIVAKKELDAELEALGVASILRKTETTASRLKREADRIWRERAEIPERT